MEQKIHIIPINLSPTHLHSFPSYLHPHQSNKFITIDGSILTHHHHPVSIVYITIDSQCCVFYGFGQLYISLFLKREGGIVLKKIVPWSSQCLPLTHLPHWFIWRPQKPLCIEPCRILPRRQESQCLFSSHMRAFSAEMGNYILCRFFSSNTYWKSITYKHANSHLWMTGTQR